MRWHCSLAPSCSRPAFDITPSPVIWVGSLPPSARPHSTSPARTLRLNSFHSNKGKEQHGSFSLPCNNEKLHTTTKQCMHRSFTFPLPSKSLECWAGRWHPLAWLNCFLLLRLHLLLFFKHFLFFFFLQKRLGGAQFYFSPLFRGLLIYICRFWKLWITLWFTASPRRDRRP